MNVKIRQSCKSMKLSTSHYIIGVCYEFHFNLMVSSRIHVSTCMGGNTCEIVTVHFSQLSCPY